MHECGALLWATSGDEAVRHLPEPTGLRVGVDRDSWRHAAEPVRTACGAAVDALVGAAVDVVELPPADLRIAGSASFVTLMAEAAQQWSPWLDADPQGFGTQIRAALTAGRESQSRPTGRHWPCAPSSDVASLACSRRSGSMRSRFPPCR